MFSAIFGGLLGEVVAPRPITNKEIWALLKSGQTDRALNELRNPKNSIDVNAVDGVHGRTLLHMACAMGAMELVVELLSQGADIAAYSADGNNSLHFAAVNDRKGIVEVLLRSGADPSIPNKAGLLPVELAKTAPVRELFLRDRSAPGVGNKASATMPAEGESGKTAFNMADELEGASDSMKMLSLDVPPPPPASLGVDLDLVGVTSPAPCSRQHSDLAGPSRTQASSADTGDYTIVGVASVKKPHAKTGLNSRVEDYDSSENSAAEYERHLAARQARPHHGNTGILEDRARSSSQGSAESPRKAKISPAGVPKLNLGGLPSLPPPPTDSEYPASFQQPLSGGQSGALASARSGGASSSASASRSNSINFFQTQPGVLTGGPAVAGSMTTPRSARDRNGLSSSSFDGTPVQDGVTGLFGTATTPGDLFLLDKQLQEDSDLRQAVMAAAAQTAQAMQGNRDDFEARRLVVRNCQKLNATHLGKLLAFDPRLAMSRMTEMGNLAVDGQTPLHVAASFGNIPALKIFVEKGQDVSLWVRDLQGRTPLHVAAEKGQMETCEYLRAAMQAEKQKDPVGEDAPTDLAGTTPLGWATIGAKGKPKKTEMIKSLFSPGDRSILPRTPVSTRAGKSPWKAPSTAGYDKVVRENVVFAFSEAHGWTVGMEDRILVSCPVIGRPAWSFFGVCDGHGGAFCSEFLANNLPGMLAKEAAVLARYMGSSFLPGGTSNDSDTNPHQLKEILHRICIDADKQLSEHPRMFVERSGAGAKARFTGMDNSGSTAILTLVTSQYVAVANVGDSRAVLAVRPQGALQAATSVLHPFPSTSPRGATPSHADLSISAGAVGAGDVPVGFSFSSGGTESVLDAVGLSRDHKATIPEEKERIVAAGASIEQVGESVEGREPVFQVFTPACDVKLRMTRSFGDFYLKQNQDVPYEQQAVMAVPEVLVHTRSSRDAFIVLACDGIWDVMTNQQVVDFIGDKLGYTAYGGPVGGATTQSVATACDALLQLCLERGTVDNISVVVIVLGAPASTPIIVQGASASSRGTPVFSTPNAAGLHEAMSGAVMTTPSRSTAVRAHHTAASQAHSHAHPSRSLAKKSQDEQDSVDLPIFDVVRHSNTGSLNEIFAAVADQDDVDCTGSPLNTAAGSNKVRKQLSFTNS